MTYLVLARKWRPRSFDTLVGQDHVVRALTHALDTQRLHHAWLFTGTRGVGKTTLSRILAKSLNCETGITSKPCGVCRACTEIDAGRFVDYLELDAASNRGVEEMTQLLEQAVYAPGAGRFKVYMIDEVHMLTGHAFNAMLKTLEEPPPHVKFILATTDPQKIPVTVLSRCLQFNLKQMPADSIVGHLQAVLGQEDVGFEIPALRLIGQAASGSMRDALSLTDQAIAYSAGNLTEDAVRGMLGTIDQRHLVRLLDALSSGDAKGVLAVADELAIRGLSYAGALADLAVLLSRVAIEQRVTGVTAAEDPLAADIARLALALHPDAVQLFYSVAVHSRGELTLAPDEYAGFIMACLRMLALNGDAGPQTALEAPAAPARQTAAPAAAAAIAAPTGAEAGASKPGAASTAASSTSAASTAAVSTAAVSTAAVSTAAVPASAQAADAPSAAAQSPEAQSAAAGQPIAATSDAGTADAPAANASAPFDGAAAAAATPADGSASSPDAAHSPSISSANDAAAPAQPAPPAAAAPAQSSAASAPQSGDPNNVPPWEDLPADAASPNPVSAKAQNSAALAVTPAAAAIAPAVDDADGPPAWVDEEIPFEAEGGFMPDSGFTSDPDDDFETLATSPSPAPAPPAARRDGPAPARKRQSRAPRLADMDAASWPELAARLPVTGLASELARQSEWAGVQGDAIILRVAVKTLAESESRVRLQTVLCEHFGQGIRLDVRVGVTGDATAYAVAQAESAARQLAAENAVADDPFVQALLADFGGHVVPGSIRHVDSSAAA
ncbi:DNA polymerase III subunit gamma/tau [Achromobacter sp. SLBN-14]|uniref:DNA polymerase III subunit gamma/tau n=1 Tax=Achromobacter sp. SLBN-14 TaxID=2768442 RepID=UPI0011528906|nr:DNA polymerase III subunit gamma/tau [Achromobacter sp. SLBN-14]TQJ96912.1 DNA polymerase-3 subunit gamma/tau [Achromobacter sp. SLBN-14]